MGIFNDDCCIHNINGECSLNLASLAAENEKLKDQIKIQEWPKISFAWTGMYYEIESSLSNDYPQPVAVLVIESIVETKAMKTSNSFHHLHIRTNGGNPRDTIERALKKFEEENGIKVARKYLRDFQKAHLNKERFPKYGDGGMF